MTTKRRILRPNYNNIGFFPLSLIERDKSRHPWRARQPCNYIQITVINGCLTVIRAFTRNMPKSSMCTAHSVSSICYTFTFYKIFYLGRRSPRPSGRVMHIFFPTLSGQADVLTSELSNNTKKQTTAIPYFDVRSTGFFFG